MSDDEERRMNLEFLGPDESPICYAFLGKNGAFHPDPIPESIRVAIIIKDGQFTTRLLGPSPR
jgi:hypothetical protein